VEAAQEAAANAQATADAALAALQAAAGDEDARAELEAQLANAQAALEAAQSEAADAAANAEAAIAEAATAAAESAAAPEEVDLHIAWWGSQTRHDRTITVINAFMEKYPHINITYEFSSFGDYWPLLSTKVAAGELPDIIQQDYAYFTQYVTDGLLAPLDPFVESGAINLADVPAEAIDGGRIDGQLYALSLGTNSQSFVIDTALFEQAGVPAPAADWTWADFEETNLAIHDALGIYGTGGGLENPQIINALYLSRGEGLYSDDGKALGFTDPQPLIDYFNMMLRLQEAGALLPREEAVANPPTLENNALVSGQAAMYFAHTNQLVGLWTAAGADRPLVMVPVPRANDGTQPANYLKPSMFFSMSANTEHPEEAALFIDYFTNSVAANQVLQAERGVPISTAVQEALLPMMPLAAAAPFDFLNAIEVSAIRPPDPAAHNDIVSNIWTPLVVDPIMYGQITPEEGVAIFMEEANALLASQ
jgi:multiple sugar transport system substrate-binding protein